MIGCLLEGNDQSKGTAAQAHAGLRFAAFSLQWGPALSLLLPARAWPSCIDQAGYLLLIRLDIPSAANLMAAQGDCQITVQGSLAPHASQDHSLIPAVMRNPGTAPRDQAWQFGCVLDVQPTWIQRPSGAAAVWGQALLQLHRHWPFALPWGQAACRWSRCAAVQPATAIGAAICMQAGF